MRRSAGTSSPRPRRRSKQGAEVAGEQRSIATATDWEDVGLAGRFAWWLAYSISTLILGLILLLAAPHLDAAITWAAGERTGASIGLGAATFLLLPIVAVLLLATIVGIPLGLFILLGIALLYSVGYVIGAHAIGRRLVAYPKSRYVAFLAGWGIVRLLGLIPIVGGVVWTLVTIFGLGILVDGREEARVEGIGGCDPTTSATRACPSGLSSEPFELRTSACEA